MFLLLVLSTAWQCKESSTRERPGGRLGSAHAFPAKLSNEASGPPSRAHLSCPHPSHSKIPCTWPSLREPGPGQGICFALLCIAFTCRYLLHPLWLCLGQSLARESTLNPVTQQGGSPLFPLILTVSYPYPSPCLSIDNVWVEFSFTLIDFRFQISVCFFSICFYHLVTSRVNLAYELCCASSFTCFC